MKTRNDFVSNSSSSSFIVITDRGMLSKMSKSLENSTYVSIPCETGNLEFGWEFRDYCMFDSKLNWIAINLLYQYAAERAAEMKAGRKGNSPKDNLDTYGMFNEWYAMLEKVMKEKFGKDINLDTKYIWIFGDSEPYIDLKDCYIDHQSNLFENPSAMKMFKSEEMLYNFLAYEDSYVSTGNDNEPAPGDVE